MKPARKLAESKNETICIINETEKSLPGNFIV